MLLVSTTVRSSTIHGIGCFTNEAIPCGQRIWSFNRHVDSIIMKSALHRLPAAAQDYLDFYGYESRHLFRPCLVLCGDDARYMNHSDQPNVIKNIADQDIAAGEELTCDYYSFDRAAISKLGERKPASAADAQRCMPAAAPCEPVTQNGKSTLRQLLRRMFRRELEGPMDEHSPRNWTDEFSFSLKPSSIEGVGVFANHAIARGTFLKLFSEIGSRRIRRSSPMPLERRNFLKRYCIENDRADAFFGPRDFGRMSVGWYLNHSSQPNAAHCKFSYFAIRDIASGEEVTIDYGTLEPRFAKGPAQFP